MAQVNPFVLRHTVNIVQLLLLCEGQGTGAARYLILTVSAVLLGKGLANTSLEQVQQAAAKAYLHEQIVRLPEQYCTDAQQLSGGQQRIAIARLFLKSPPIIFLDEPTASLGAVTIEQIKISLDALKLGRTEVIISPQLLPNRG